ncbi:hypothetical protein ACJJI3_16045 [Microbulbifer sp. ZKSA004]|uniref:hypothetical protein n=1 Tax=Microbulbifer sp. ZKSA004 TaxID=3243389 RepID=UPI00403A5E92
MNYESKLNELNARRALPQHIKEGMTFDSEFSKSIKEDYQEINESGIVKYIIGAMQPVNSRYTEICFEEGNRVARALNQDLENHGIYSTHKFQGSVPLDIHIKGASDVDVLIFHNYITYEIPMASHKSYIPCKEGISMSVRMRKLRLNSEAILKGRYPAAKVNINGAKSIAMEGGSLQRKVDIVPAHWHDTLKYQNSNQIEDREVQLYDKERDITFGNWPFKHMHLIDQRDRRYSGNVKKVCRLLKNIKADASNHKEILVSLSSYDIAGLVYHMDDQLNSPSFYDLGLLGRVNDYMQSICANNCYLGNQLITPDGSRRILDSDERQAGVLALTLEVNSLYRDLLKDTAPNLDESAGRVYLNNRAVYI